MPYEVEDITVQVYELLRKKRVAVEKHREAFITEGRQNWQEMLVGQTEYANVPLEEFKQKMARYLYVVRK